MKIRKPDDRVKAVEPVVAEDKKGPTHAERTRRQLAGLGYEEQLAAMSVPAGRGDGAAASKTKVQPRSKEEVEGIATRVSVDRFVDVARDLQGSWQDKGTIARAEQLGDAANAELETASVPATGIVVKSLGVRSGEFDYQPWALALARETFEQGEISSEEMSTVAGVVYHEARHAEQWHRMMRLEAGRGVTADQLAETYAIKKEIAEDAAAEPMIAEGKDGAQASTWYESVYGANLAERGRILTQLDERGAVFQGALDAMNAAGDRYDRLAADPSTDPGVVQATQDEWNGLTVKYVEAKAAFEAAYKEYRSLPEEQDAWAVGDHVEGAYGKD